MYHTMPQFTFCSAGIPVDLDIVEEEYIEALGDEGSRETVTFLGSRSYLFEALCLMGITCTARGKFSQNLFDEVTAPMSELIREVSFDFLAVKYTFKSYY